MNTDFVGIFTLHVSHPLRKVSKINTEGSSQHTRRNGECFVKGTFERDLGHDGYETWKNQVQVESVVTRILRRCRKWWNLKGEKCRKNYCQTPAAAWTRLRIPVVRVVDRKSKQPGRDRPSERTVVGALVPVEHRRIVFESWIVGWCRY